MPPGRPTIGLVPDIELVRNRGVDFRRYFLYAELAERVLEAGGLPLLLPYSDDVAVVEAVIAQLDGLLLVGGDFDIDPHRYGEKPHARLGTLKPDRSDFEWRLFENARASGLPVLGICGGMQLINVACGGGLWQDLPAQRPSELVHVQAHNRKVPAHPVDVRGDTQLAQICGAGALRVNSTHHQGIKTLGAGLVTSAVASDALIEAIELPELPYCVGVQWHPETLENTDDAHRHQAIFAALVEAARVGRERS